MSSPVDLVLLRISVLAEDPSSTFCSYRLIWNSRGGVREGPNLEYCCRNTHSCLRHAHAGPHPVFFLMPVSLHYSREGVRYYSILEQSVTNTRFDRNHYAWGGDIVAYTVTIIRSNNSRQAQSGKRHQGAGRFVFVHRGRGCGNGRSIARRQGGD